MQLSTDPDIPLPHEAGWRERLVEAQAQRWAMLRALGGQERFHLSGRATYIHAEALAWMAALPACSIHAIVTDPPYGLIEYEDAQLRKRSAGSGGVWRIPPAFDGAQRAPLPRFTVLTDADLAALHGFFGAVAAAALRVLVPGGHVVIASTPLLSSLCFHAFQQAGLEKRGEIIRQVQTLRGGDRPKGAETEFADVSVMPRSCWEPWGLFRKPLAGTVAANLRAWGAGGLRRTEAGEPFRDLIVCSPTRAAERALAPHPSLKPQRFMRQIVRAVLPLGIGIVYDPFAGGGSTLAAAEAVGCCAIGTDRVLEYVELGCRGFADLVSLKT